MVKKVILSLAAAFGLFSGAHAQFTTTSRCGTDEVTSEAKARFPQQIAENERQFKEELDRAMHGINLSQFARTNFGSFDTVYHIPIVFHIIHDYGTEYISDDQVYAMLTRINKLYAKENGTSDIVAPFAGNIRGTNVPYAAKSNIVFHFPTKDPSGQPTHGITRRRDFTTNNASDIAKFDLWPPANYINVWLINRFGGAQAGVGAYAYNPQSVAASTYLPFVDGVISITSQASDSGTLAHELGHSLNLQHPWGGASGILNATIPCGGDDGVDDTPPTKGHNLNPGCTPQNLYDTACVTPKIDSAHPYGFSVLYDSASAQTLFDIHLPNSNNNTKLLIDYPDTTNAQNIMDYTFCDRMFTHLQAFRMRVALTSSQASRNNLISAANLNTTGALQPRQDLDPIPDFSMGRLTSDPIRPEKVYGCADPNLSQFQFIDRSWNDTITSRSWTFSNGGPTTNLNNQTVSGGFSTPGWVTVTLNATGKKDGVDNTKSVTRTPVYIAAATGTNPDGYYQEFDPNGDRDKWPSFNYYNNSHKWEVVSGIGFQDGYCMRYSNYDNRSTIPAVLTGVPAGDYDDLFTPGFDLSGPNATNDTVFNFWNAGAFRSGNAADMNDVVRIAYSINCGNTWISIDSLTKGNLASGGTVSSYYTPRPQDWKFHSTILPSAARRNANVMFRFRFFPGVFVSQGGSPLVGSGNNFYLDRVSISNRRTGIDKDLVANSGMVLAPNPTHAGSTLTVNGNGETGTVIVMDVAGKVVYTAQKQISGLTSIEIPASATEAKGMYLVQFVSSTQNHTSKLVVY